MTPPSPKLSKSIPVVTSIREAQGREEDVYGWLLSQARELRSHKPDFLDWNGLAEELDELVALAKSEVVSRCSQILAHLLKWQFQTTRRAEKSWRSTIIRERLTVAEMLDSSSNLRNYMQDKGGFARAYRDARKLAGTDMDLAPRDWDRVFPLESEWRFEQMLDEGFFPSVSTVKVRQPR
jgi:hypothetical protein